LNALRAGVQNTSSSVADTAELSVMLAPLVTFRP
jgi:hypothetical protein